MTGGEPGAGATTGAVRPPRVSVVIPVFNEEDVVPELVRRVRAVLDALPGGPHEVVFVDDGSHDRTLELLEAATREDPRLVVVSFSRNFGHQPAVCAGLDHATGDVVVVMDGDLQDTPESIPRLLEEHARGFDVVYARRVRRKEGPLLRLCYFTFYRLMAAFSSVTIPLDSGDFSLLSRRAVDAIKALPERQRYVRGLRAWVGFRQTGIDVERDARAAGATKYGLAKLLRLAFDGLFAFSVVPLRASAALGMASIAAALAFAGYTLYVKLFDPRDVPLGFSATLSVIVFLSGVQLLSLGVIGEYVGRVYEETKGRPIYVVRSVTGRLGSGAPGG